MIKTILVDARNIEQVLPEVEVKLAKTELYGFDLETQDEARHAGLNTYNNKKRHVFDHRRTTITGFSVYADGDDTAYYFNMAHADVENRLDPSVGVQLLDKVNPEAIMVCHNAPFELVMTDQCWGYELKNVVCTLQMAVSHHNPDEYDYDAFMKASLPYAFHKIAAEAVTTFADYTPGGSLTGDQQELLGKFIAKESKAAHCYNGFVSEIAMGYNLKKLTLSRFGVKQKGFWELLDEFGASHMGELTGEQVCSYGADDSYWAVQHYKWMLADMLANNPKALMAFFDTENPMIHVYAEAWKEGIRLDLNQVYVRRDEERKIMAQLLRDFKARIRAALPFPEEPHEKLLAKEGWYAKSWKKKRTDIALWAETEDFEDDFKQCYQTSNPIGNAWAEEKGMVVPKGRLNLGYWQTHRALMYDLLRVPIQYDGGGVASDSDARGRIRDKLDDNSLHGKIMADIQEMAEIEQRMKLYLTPYSQLMDPETSRVYPSLSSQLATRRLATSFPNPMQLAKSGNSTYIRGFYLGDTDDHVVVSADWSAIELVLIGDFSGDAGFAKVYGQLPYGDMHSGSAVDGLSVKTLPGLTEEEFREFKFDRNPEGRILKDLTGNTLNPSKFYKWARGTAVGKGINFGYWYSGACSTVANNLGLSSDEHWELVDRYRARFPEAEAWRIATQQEATIYGQVRLPDGQVRTKFDATKPWRDAMKKKFVDLSAAPGLMSYADLAIKRIQARARNQVVNAAIQGSCATLAKRSLLSLKKACFDAGLVWGVDVRLMMPIHDELVFSVHRQHVMDFIPLLRKAMVTHPDIVKTLPLDCTVAIGRTFRPFDFTNPKLTQIELDEAQVIDGVIGKDLEGNKLTDDQVRDVLEYIFS